jgi:hypothetical protein
MPKKKSSDQARDSTPKSAPDENAISSNPVAGTAERGVSLDPREIADDAPRDQAHEQTHAAPSHGYPISDEQVQRLKLDAERAPLPATPRGHSDPSAAKKHR